MLPTSRCENLYDGNRDGYASLSRNGGDSGRSFVANDALSSQIVLHLINVYDISHFIFYQRLYNGFDNQVDEVTIRLYGVSGTLILSQNSKLARAEPPMLPMDSFAATVELSKIARRVKRIEIYITKTDDNDDSGFAEIEIANKCTSPPPPPPLPSKPPPPPPSGPVLAPTEQVIKSLKGSIDGVRIASAYRGTLGSITTQPQPQQPIGLSLYDCAQFCGHFHSVFEFFTGTLSSLPHTMHQCTCYELGTWTVVDSSAVEFVHGTPPQTTTTAPAVPIDTTPSNPRMLHPIPGYILPFEVPPTTTAFDIKVSFITKSTVDLGNILRVAPWRLTAECRPCLGISGNGKIVANLMFTERGWSTYAESSHVVEPNTKYVVRMVLHDRTLRVFVYYGDSVQSEPISEANSGLALSGDFPRNEKSVLFVAGFFGQFTNVLLDTDSIVFSNSLSSQLSMDFKFDTNDMLKNSIRYHVGFEAHSLIHASQTLEASISSPSTAVSTPNGFHGYGISFDRHSALVLRSSQNFLTPEFTVCAWAKRTLPLDTLFTTLFGFGEDFVVHYSAYFSDLSLGIGDSQLRASPTSLATPGLEWTHVCASTARGGNAIFYMNGTRVAATKLVEDVSSNGYFSIGASIEASVYATTGNDRGFGGVIDEVKGWARQLSDSEIRNVSLL